MATDAIEQIRARILSASILLNDIEAGRADTADTWRLVAEDLEVAAKTASAAADETAEREDRDNGD